MTRSDGGLKYQCSECGTFCPAGSVRCHRCGTEFDQEEENVEAILEELTALLNDDVEDGEADMRTPIEEVKRLPKKVPSKGDSTSTKPDGKVKYKRVKKLPP